MTVFLIVVGLVLVMAGAFAMADEMWALGLVAFIAGAAAIGWGIYVVEQQEAREKRACEARGGNYVEQYREKNLCLAPGVLR